MIIPADDPRAVAAAEAIAAGDVEWLEALLLEHPELATVALASDDTTRTLLHVVTDWPGHRPNRARVVRLLVDAGADVNARFSGPHTETPLHWAASSDDVEVLDALLDAGAHVEAPGAVIGGGTAMADATAFGQWNAARRLLERGASTNLWEAAALGLLDRVQAHVAASPDSAERITEAFWAACHGGQLTTARYLAGRGADIDWVGWDGLTPLDAAVRSDAHEVAAWLAAQGGHHAGDLGDAGT